MSAPFDTSRIQRGARLRRTPYFEATQRHGARGYSVYNHMLFPIDYADLEDEYDRLLNHVTVWDVGVERQVEIKGPDGFAFTNMLTPRDLNKCKVGQGKYVILTDERGGIVNDPVLLRLDQNHFWLAAADSDVLLWAKGVALNAGMTVEIGEPDVSPMQIQGPKSKDVLRSLLGDEILSLKYYYFLRTELEGIPLIVTRTGWTGEVGYEIYLCDGTRGVDLWERVMEAGAPYNIAPTGPCDIRRVEAGILNYGADITLDTNPYEVDLGWMVDLDQEDDFIGRAALARIREEGVRRKLVGVEVAGERIEFNMTKWPVEDAGRRIGHITSALYSPRLRKNIGYAMVAAEHACPGTTFTVKVEGGQEREATVVPKPFVDPKKSIPKS
ncbi:MAG: glycine cleavage system protein T [Gammaproteobacteria bacterium]|nr:glycine cleavage system protein T [Gammaproteobacteria bacterium]NIR85801.1 glycine cleavage system protein T [Gammaproteobacteria bacterium]NIR90555.1 glycine cleavage system protein T [Gammaproteobacteria bacterium]NIU06936.1 glycine cleavage system protein T [Gammaproteobacteria bacterium]NIV53866.1 glycine cleavage system protein T [Gammaproteobacteria bacterium]